MNTREKWRWGNGSGRSGGEAAAGGPAVARGLATVKGGRSATNGDKAYSSCVTTRQLFLGGQAPVFSARTSSGNHNNNGGGTGAAQNGVLLDGGGMDADEALGYPAGNLLARQVVLNDAQSNLSAEPGRKPRRIRRAIIQGHWGYSCGRRRLLNPIPKAVDTAAKVRDKVTVAHKKGVERSVSGTC